MSLRPYQDKGVNRIREAFKTKRSVCLRLDTGGGKCLGVDTPVIMFDGTIKKVQDVAVGDILRSHDDSPRLVTSLARGRERMYRITPIKGEPFTCNESHILSLKWTGKYNETPLNVSVKEYLTFCDGWKHKLKLWRSPANFEEKSLPIPPYVFGIWLGDGDSNGFGFTEHNNDKEVIAAWIDYVESIGGRVQADYNSEKSTRFNPRFDNSRGAGNITPFRKILTKNNLLNNKHIPQSYKISSYEQRMEFLAGIIDTDGYYDKKGGFQIVMKEKHIIDDIAFIARSCGFAAYPNSVKKKCHNNGKIGTYYTINISGDTHLIPTRLPRKQACVRGQKKNVLMTGFLVEDLGEGDYYGFEIEGNDRLFLLGDFTVTHNTKIFSYISMLCDKNNKNVVILVHRKNLVAQVSDALAREGVTHNIIASTKIIQKCVANHRNHYGRSFYSRTANVNVCMVQTVVNKPDIIAKCDMLINDETHHILCNTNQKIISHLKSTAKILGVTATPVRGDGKGLGDVFEELIEVITMQELIDLGYLCTPIHYAPPVEFANEKIHKRMGDYSIKELAEDANNRKIYGDAIAHYRKICDKVPAIAFCINIAESKQVAEDFRNAGYNAVSVDGTMSDEDINDALEGLASGKYHLVSTCDLISEGTDIPLVACVIELRRTLSLGLIQQIRGRVLRPYPDCELMRQPHMQKLIRDGRHVAFILDCANNTARHGLVHQPRVWTLDGVAEDTEKAKPTRQCPTCFSVHYASKTCPNCGHVYALKKEGTLPTKKKTEVVDVELVEVKLDWSNPESIKKASYKEVMRKARTREQLEEVARAKGYKMAWVDKMMEVRGSR